VVRILVVGFVELAAFFYLSACDSDPRAASRQYLERGNQYFARSKYKEASLLYRRALKKDARYAEAWHQLGVTNYQLGIYAEARKDFSRAMDLDPADTVAMARLGDLDLLFYAADQRANREFLADLKDLSRRLLKRDKKSYDGFRLAGEIALIERDLPEAIRRFEDANAAKPYQRELVLVLAQSLETAGDDERAVSLARETVERDRSAGAIYDFLYVNCLRRRQFEAAERVLQEKIANNPDEGGYLVELAFHYYRTHRPQLMNAALDRLVAKRDELADVRLQVGDFHARIREFDRALEQYRLGERENRKKRRVYQKKMVEVLATVGRREEAARVLAGVMREDPKDPEAIGLHATLLLSSGSQADLKQATGELESLARKNAGSAVLHYDLGRAYLAGGAADQAKAQFAEALRIDPNHHSARFGLAQAELAHGDSGLAVAESGRVLSAEPANAAARLLRARALANTGEYARARQDLEVALGMDSRSADARFELGELDLKERRFEDAEVQFRSLIADGDARGAAGAIDVRAGQGRYDEAIRMVQERIQSMPDPGGYQAILANLLLRAGRFPEAAEQLQILIQRNPNTAEYYLRLGDAQAQSGDRGGASEAFEKARALSPADGTADADLGILLERAGDFTSARAAYEAALRKQPDNATALNNLAYLESEHGADLDRALAYARRARAKRPDDVNVIDTLGVIYIKKNLTDEGLGMLREAVKREPANATFRLHLAAAWYQKGDRGMARKELEAARRSKPTEAERAAIQALLARVGQA
jgi:tetratricopeptide (TPR) repeat protein